MRDSLKEATQHWDHSQTQLEDLIKGHISSSMQ
jgi:hypothetical protein